MDRISKFAEVAGTLSEKTKALSHEAVERTGNIVERTGGALAEAKGAVQRVEARADEVILSSMDRFKTSSKTSRSARSDSPGSGGESSDITEQPEYSPVVVEAERGRGSGLARFTGEAFEAATSVGRSSMSMLRREPSPDPVPSTAASGGYSTRSWGSRAAEADAPVDNKRGRTDPDIEPTHSPPAAAGAANAKSAAWWKGKRGGEETGPAKQRPSPDEDEDEFGERKGLLSGVGDVTGRVANATAQKARAAGQKVGLVEKPPETLLEQVQSELPSLKKKTRVKSFAVCFTLGCCLMMLSTVFIPTIALAPCDPQQTHVTDRITHARSTLCNQHINRVLNHASYGSLRSSLRSILPICETQRASRFVFAGGASRVLTAWAI